MRCADRAARRRPRRPAAVRWPRRPRGARFTGSRIGGTAGGGAYEGGGGPPPGPRRGPPTPRRSLHRLAHRGHGGRVVVRAVAGPPAGARRGPPTDQLPRPPGAGLPDGRRGPVRGEAALDAFLRSLAARDASEHTIRSY